MRRLLVLLALVLCALTFAPPAPAAAADADPNTGELRYEGIRTETPRQGAVRTREVDVDLVCADGVCVDEGFFVPFVDGVAEIDLPATGTGCDLENDIRARQGTLTAGDGRLVGEVDFLTRPLDCPDGTFRTDGTLTGYDLVLVSGDECLLDASCVAAEPGTTLTYRGTVTSSFGNGTSEPAREVEFMLDCDGATCAIRGGEIEFVDGIADTDTPAAADPCVAGVERRATHVRLTATATAITGTIVWDQLDDLDCPSGTTTVYSTTSVYDLELVVGDPCLLDGSCTENSGLDDCCANPGAPRPFATPTVFGGLATTADVVTPGNVAWAVVGTVILALLVAIPTHFFNASAETLSERIGAWWRRRRGREDAAPARGLTGWPWAAGGVLAAAVIAAFADPAFGFDAAGVRVLLSIAASFGIEVVLGWVAVILIVRRTHPTAAATVRFAPLTLLLVAAAVLLTRVTGFEPPIVFGLVAGVAFGGLLATAERARVALIGLGWSFGIGLLAWLGYSLLPGDAVVVRELLATAAIAGLSTLPVALLPVRGLAGRTVWEADRRGWAAAYAVGLFAFLLVLLPLPASWAEVGLGLWAWIGLYGAYALASVAIWLVVARPWQRTTSP